MNVGSINQRIEDLKNQALTEFGVDVETAAQIGIAAAPNPEMGDLGFPCFALARVLRKAPPAIAAEVAEKFQELMTDDDAFIASVAPVGPYVNLTFNASVLARIVLNDALESGMAFGADQVEPSHWMIEYSAPNTNKPQHLGHVRNNLLGATVSTILKFAGHEVTRVNLINDRGIHICKSMLAYELFGEGETPESSGIKGDHLVGKYYVRFAIEFAKEYETWQSSDAAAAKRDAWVAELADKAKEGKDDAQLTKDFFKSYEDTFFNNESELGGQAKEMLRKWEAGDGEVVALWNTMNSWVFAGFDETYKRLGVEFERVYKESETYLLGKDVVLQGLESGKFRQLDDGAIVCDLEPLGFDGQKVLLRRDGTSVYMTQDLGTALARFDDYDIDNMVYVVGDEQNYHFQVLFKILALLRPELDGHLNHLSYGMVLLPEGKMKSREGKVVDADDLVAGMVELAEESIRERYDDLSDDEIAHRAEVIGLAALKYYLLDFNPKTTVHFDPKQSIDFEGRTGPYCLYSYARIQSIAAKMGGWPEPSNEALEALGTDLEMSVVKLIQDYPGAVSAAERLLDPSKVTEHVFKLAKAFSSLYNDRDHRIKDIEGPRRDGLMLLTRAVAETMKNGLALLGIDVLESM